MGGRLSLFGAARRGGAGRKLVARRAILNLSRFAALAPS